MLGDILILHLFHLLAQEMGFLFVLQEASRFHISNGIWNIIADHSTDVQKAFFEGSNRGFGIWRSFIRQVSYFSGHLYLRILFTIMVRSYAIIFPTLNRLDGILSLIWADSIG